MHSARLMEDADPRAQPTEPSAGAATRPDIAPPARLLKLDALRGLAALAVVIYHFTRPFPSDPDFFRQSAVTAAWGKHGVELFFVISGFVIFMTLSRTRRPVDFIVSRFARLYPAYWAGIAFTTAVVLALDVEPLQRSAYEIAVNVTMLQGLPFTGARDVDWSYWSLFTELLFYLVMLALFASNGLRRIELVLAMALLAAVAYSAANAAADAYVLHWRIEAALDYLRPILPYAPYFVIGICLYRLWRHENVAVAAGLLLAAVATVAATLTTAQLTAALIAIAAFGLILTGRASLLRTRPLVWLGGISYSLYLVHSFAGRAAMIRLQQAGWSPEAALLAALVAVLAAATLINQTVERPALKAIRDAHGRGWGMLSQSGFAGHPGKPRNWRLWLVTASIGGAGAWAILGTEA